MPYIQKVFKDPTPALRFIGKRYFEVGGHWGEWFANGWFDTVETAMGGVDKITAIWENGGGYIGLEIADRSNAEESRVQVRFKWGFNLDAEDRERINKEREKQNTDLEKFEKTYNRLAKKKATRTVTVEVTDEEDAEEITEETVTVPVPPSEDNAGMPSISLTPPDLTTAAKEADGDASDEA